MSSKGIKNVIERTLIKRSGVKRSIPPLFCESAICRTIKEALLLHQSLANNLRIISATRICFDNIHSIKSFWIFIFVYLSSLKPDRHCCTETIRSWRYNGEIIHLKLFTIFIIFARQQQSIEKIRHWYF